MDVKMDTLKNDARCHIAVWRGRGTPDPRRGHLLGGNGLRGEPLQGGAQHKPPRAAPHLLCWASLSALPLTVALELQHAHSRCSTNAEYRFGWVGRGMSSEKPQACFRPSVTSTADAWVPRGCVLGTQEHCGLSFQADPPPGSQLWLGENKEQHR